MNSLSNLDYSIVFAINKLDFYIQKFKQFFSGRKIIVAKEITKLYETFFRSEVDKILIPEKFSKGELTIIISEILNKKITKVASIDKKIINMAKKNLKRYSIRDTVELISKTERVNRKLIYNLCLKIKNEKNN